MLIKTFHTPRPLVAAMARPSTLSGVEPELLCHLQELSMHIVPFAQAQFRQEVLLAGFAKLSARYLALEVLHEIPKLQPAEKIGIRVEPLRMGQVGFLLSLGRPASRVL